MTQPFRLQVVLDVAQRRLEAARVRVSHLGVALAREQEQLAPIKAERAQHEGALRKLLAAGIEAQRLRNLYAFIGHLARQERGQVHARARAQQALDVARLEWLDLRRGEQGLRALARLHIRAQVSAEGRREQRAQDEFALKSRKDSPFEHR